MSLLKYSDVDASFPFKSASIEIRPESECVVNLLVTSQKALHLSHFL